MMQCSLQGELLIKGCFMGFTLKYLFILHSSGSSVEVDNVIADRRHKH